MGGGLTQKLLICDGKQYQKCSKHIKILWNNINIDWVLKYNNTSKPVDLLAINQSSVFENKGWFVDSALFFFFVVVGGRGKCNEGNGTQWYQISYMKGNWDDFDANWIKFWSLFKGVVIVLSYLEVIFCPLWWHWPWGSTSLLHIYQHRITAEISVAKIVSLCWFC